MAQISENADGTYSKTYSDVEVAIIRELHSIRNVMSEQVLEIWSAVGTLQAKVEGLEQAQVSLTDIEKLINAQGFIIEDHSQRITQLEKVTNTSVYSDEEVNKFMIPWKVEQISHAFETPKNQFFDESNIHDIRSGYVHYPNADINEPHGFQVPPNTMKRYTIWAYCDDPRVAQLRIRYADRCVVLQNEIEKAVYTEVGGNFDGTAKILTMHLDRGWTKIQFLIANETQEGGLEISSDLVDQVDALTSMDYISGKFTGDQIEKGSLGPEHFSNNMNMIVRTLHATLTDEPAFIVGNPTTNGSFQVADGVISKSKDEPFVLQGDVRITGQLLVEDLDIDVSPVKVTSLSDALTVSQSGSSVYLGLDTSALATAASLEALKKSHDALRIEFDDLKKKYNLLEPDHQTLKQNFQTLSNNYDNLLNRVKALETT